MNISGDVATIRDLFDTSPEAKERRDKEAEEMQALYDSTIVWSHEKCIGRHGIVPEPKVKLHGEQKILRMLTYYFGNKPAWKDKAGNLEFVHMTKVYPAPKKPWEWCGHAILPDFEAWRTEGQRRNEANWDVRNRLKIGTIVSFKARDGSTVEGEVVRILTLIHVKVGTQIWRVTPSLLTILDKPSKPVGLSAEQERVLREAGLL